MADTDHLDGPRACRAEELPELLELVNYVFRTSQGRPPDIGDAYRHIYCEENLELVRVIRMDGSIRASVGLFPFELAAGPHTFSALGLNCTTCHPQWRRRGLGALLMRDAADLVEQKSLDMLHLAGGVPEWYRQLGYEQAGSRYLYHFDRGNIEQVHALHIAQRSGNMRSLHNTRQSFARYPGELLAAKQNGELKAYLYADFDNLVLECAGQPAELIAGLTRELFDRRDRENEGASTTGRDEKHRVLRNVLISLEVSPLRADLIALLGGLGIPCERNLWHMVRVTDPPALADKIGFEGTIEAADEDAFVVATDNGEQTMTRGAIGRMLFGPERFSLCTQEPIPLFAPGTDHV
jgi:predicted N-acetyltransferase YhbS